MCAVITGLWLIPDALVPPGPPSGHVGLAGEQVIRLAVFAGFRLTAGTGASRFPQ